MKNFTLLFFISSLLLMQFEVCSATTWGISNVGTTFSPSTLTIQVGDVVNFTLSQDHNAVEVSQATYNAGGNTPLDGSNFKINYGGGSHTFTAAGTYYFVCTPHASVGMKGIITVQMATGINAPTDQPDFRLFPNPAAKFTSFTIDYMLESKAKVNIGLVNVSGKTVTTFLSALRDAGSHEESYPIEAIEPGTYMVRVQYGNKSFTKKLIIE
jgi:plastocyanin